MVCYATAVSDEKILGVIWRHDVTLAPREGNVTDSISITEAMLVLPLAVKEGRVAMCLSFTAKDPSEKKRPWHLPVHSSVYTPARGMGLQFDQKPIFLPERTWVNYNTIAFLPLTSLVSVSDDEAEWPRLTRQDIGVLLFYNDGLEMFLPFPTNKERGDSKTKSEDTWREHMDADWVKQYERIKAHIEKEGRK